MSLLAKRQRERTKREKEKFVFVEKEAVWGTAFLCVLWYGIIGKRIYLYALWAEKKRIVMT